MGPAGSRSGHPADTERTTEMFHTQDGEKVKQLKPKTIVFTALWLVLVGAVMLFIAFAGHL
jgi:hypothetical protein